MGETARSTEASTSISVLDGAVWKPKPVTANNPAPTPSDDEDDMLNNNYTPVSEGPPPQLMDVNVVMLLVEFGPPGDETEVAQLNLSPREAVFEKPKESSHHLRPLYV
ncbi:hypothetical protein GUJ93_ZPchr0013g35664 [Zizania palustris]|uniref:Uncharacterized protein n=1 Tax=Zizania palustris TaxID=103762 RepID=A0A8J5X513_ZIZPA|nr:hypothetical protein GUJ93_ZPchr0013g35664 [Zizania palustris]